MGKKSLSGFVIILHKSELNETPPWHGDVSAFFLFSFYDYFFMCVRVLFLPFVSGYLFPVSSEIVFLPSNSIFLLLLVSSPTSSGRWGEGGGFYQVLGNRLGIMLRPLKAKAWRRKFQKDERCVICFNVTRAFLTRFNVLCVSFLTKHGTLNPFTVSWRWWGTNQTCENVLWFIHSFFYHQKVKLKIKLRCFY